MADTDTYEKDLGQKSSLATSDFIRVVGSDNVSYKQPLTALGSGMLPYIQYKSSVDANDYQTSGVYYLSSNCTNMPAAYMFLAVYRGNGASDILQHAFSLAGEVYARRRTSSGTWVAWQKMPTRAEIDALNTVTQTYTPTFLWTDGTAPTVANALFSYTKIGKLCWLSGRFQITDKGAVGNSASLLISLPSGIGARGLTPSNIGTFTPNSSSEPSLFIVRVNNSTALSIGWGAGGGYSSPKITAQYYTMFAVVPIE